MPKVTKMLLKVTKMLPKVTKRTERLGTECHPTRTAERGIRCRDVEGLFVFVFGIWLKTVHCIALHTPLKIFLQRDDLEMFTTGCLLPPDHLGKSERNQKETSPQAKRDKPSLHVISLHFFSLLCLFLLLWLLIN